VLEADERSVPFDKGAGVVRRGPRLRHCHQGGGAAALHARRAFRVHDMQGNADADGGAFAEPHEIDMERKIAHRIELEVARKSRGACCPRDRCRKSLVRNRPAKIR